MIRRFDLVTEAGRAGRDVGLFEAAAGNAQSVAHAVEARQVGRRLAVGDHVVDGDRRRDVGHRDLDQLGAELLEPVERRAPGRRHRRLESAHRDFAEDADAHPGEAVLDAVEQRRHRDAPTRSGRAGRRRP